MFDGCFAARIVRRQGPQAIERVKTLLVLLQQIPQNLQVAFRDTGDGQEVQHLSGLQLERCRGQQQDMAIAERTCGAEIWLYASPQALIMLGENAVALVSLAIVMRLVHDDQVPIGAVQVFQYPRLVTSAVVEQPVIYKIQARWHLYLAAFLHTGKPFPIFSPQHSLGAIEILDHNQAINESLDERAPSFSCQVRLETVFAGVGFLFWRGQFLVPLVKQAGLAQYQHASYLGVCLAVVMPQQGKQRHRLVCLATADLIGQHHATLPGFDQASQCPPYRVLLERFLQVDQ